MIQPVTIRSNIIIAFSGTLIMLTSMVLPWYTLRLYSLGREVLKSHVGITNLLFSNWWHDSWVGSGLPVLLWTISILILVVSIMYSLLKNRETKSLWAWLGMLCALCVIGNAIYLTLYFHNHPYLGVSTNIVQAGSIIAFIGAIVVLISGVFGRGDRTSTS